MARSMMIIPVSGTVPRNPAVTAERIAAVTYVLRDHRVPPVPRDRLARGARPDHRAFPEPEARQAPRDPKEWRVRSVRRVP